MNNFAFLNSLGILSALGQGKRETARRLFAGDTSGMIPDTELLIEGSSLIGAVPGALPLVPASLAHQNSRNNRLLLAAVSEIRNEIDRAIHRYGPHRIGVILGTSTSGIREGEEAIAMLEQNGSIPETFDYQMVEMGSPALFLSEALGIAGPAYAVSTACSASAKALISARHMLLAGICDAVITGGVDSLCRLTLNGFKTLESVSPGLMNPMSINRNGLNIGEGAAVFLMSREPSSLALLGTGESSDAYHFAAPDPDGVGASIAIRDALKDAGIGPDDVSYLNLHGTATPKNDEMEAAVVSRIFPLGIPSSSTKPLTGHTLGAAGAIEAAICWLVLSEFNTDGVLPPHIWDGAVDPGLPSISLVKPGDPLRGSRYAMSNSFAFGGSNATLIIGEPK